MVKLLLQARIWLHAGLGLAVAALYFCVPVTAHGQDSGLFALLAASKKAAQAQPPSFHSTQPPTLSVSVESLGFTAPGQFYLGMRNSMVSLDFLDENRVLFTFRVPGLIHRNFAAGDDDNERQIRALVLQLPQGTVLAEAVWTLHDRSRYLYSIGNGQFLLRDKDNLLLGDASLQVKPYLHFPGPVLWLELDPTRQYLVTGSTEEAGDQSKSGESSTAAAATNVPGEDKRPGQADMVLRILRRDSGKVMLVTHVRSAVHLPINADGYLETLRSKGMAWVLNMNHFDGGSTIVGSVDSVCSPMLDFVSPKEVLVTTCTPNGDPRLVAMSTSGRHLWDDPESGWSVWPLLIMSPDGSRVARETLVSTHSVNSSAPLGTDDIKGQAVEVFDAANGKIALRTQASPVFDAGGNVAISPSGKRVAVLVAGAIQVFDLPAAPALAEPAVTQAGR